MTGPVAHTPASSPRHETNALGQQVKEKSLVIHHSDYPNEWDALILFDYRQELHNGVHLLRMPERLTG